MDTIDSEKRSWNMSRIRAVDTLPERTVRTSLHKAGFRFRLHVKTLPGKPDIVLSKFKTVVMVHGCFWHRHKKCKYAYTPKTSTIFWEKKFNQNIKRDIKVKRDLRALGWKVITIWECEVSDINKIKRVILSIGKRQ